MLRVNLLLASAPLPTPNPAPGVSGSNTAIVIAALAVSAIATISAAIIAGRAGRVVAQVNTEAQSKTEATRIKVKVVKEFLAAVDGYWQFANDLYDERRAWKRRRWIPGFQSTPSYRTRTGTVTKRVTQAQLHLEAMSGAFVKNAVDDYVRFLRNLMIDAYNAKWDKGNTGKDERNALMAAIRDELDIDSRKRE
ncbi:hypothetical protein ACIQV3_11445 [Streptomyces sp. NPDC099050]|uniref:hypothetical protein n=1 Tax=Streptomyces sp. NPDC099050 TaxID=3366100 RepID=UPI0038116859